MYIEKYVAPDAGEAALGLDTAEVGALFLGWAFFLFSCSIRTPKASQSTSDNVAGKGRYQACISLRGASVLRP